MTTSCDYPKTTVSREARWVAQSPAQWRLMLHWTLTRKHAAAPHSMHSIEKPTVDTKCASILCPRLAAPLDKSTSTQWRHTRTLLVTAKHVTSRLQLVFHIEQNICMYDTLAFTHGLPCALCHAILRSMLYSRASILNPHFCSGFPGRSSPTAMLITTLLAVSHC